MRIWLKELYGDQCLAYVLNGFNFICLLKNTMAYIDTLFMSIKQCNIYFNIYNVN